MNNYNKIIIIGVIEMVVEIDNIISFDWFTPYLERNFDLWECFHYHHKITKKTLK